MLTARRGLTLLELTLSLTVASVILLLVVTVGVREQRSLASATERLSRAEALRQGTALLPIDLRSLAPREGDIRAGEARDTSLEFRAAVLTGVICAVQSGRIALAPRGARDGLMASIVATPDVGDTAWLLSMMPDEERWLPAVVLDVGTSSTRCHGGDPPSLLTAAEASLGTRVLTIDSTSAALLGPGVPVRITRPMRYSLYRSGDGSWYLGLAEWSASRFRFDPVQPVSGPYASAARGGLRFRYFDTAGVEVASGATETRAIARIDVTLAAVAGSIAPSPAGARDSVLLTLALRNVR